MIAAEARNSLLWTRSGPVALSLSVAGRPSETDNVMLIKKSFSILVFFSFLIFFMWIVLISVKLKRRDFFWVFTRLVYKTTWATSVILIWRNLSFVTSRSVCPLLRCFLRLPSLSVFCVTLFLFTQTKTFHCRNYRLFLVFSYVVYCWVRFLSFVHV